MSCTRTLNFCVNHSFLLNPRKDAIVDDEFVNKIKTIKPQLLEFLGFYKKYSEINTCEFKKSDKKVHIKEFIVKLSQFLNVSCESSMTILAHFLQIDGIVKEDDLESMLTRGYDSLSLMRSIEKFYRQERLSLIRIVRYVFCDIKDDWAVISKIILHVSNHSDCQSLFKKILKYYETVIEDMYQSKSGIDRWDDPFEDERTTNLFEEHVALLETMLLASYSMKDCPSKEIFQDILRIFQRSSSSMELRIHNTISTRASVKAIIERIGFLQGLVLVEAADLKGLFVDEEELKSHFLSDIGLLTSINVATTKLGSRKCDAVFMLLSSLLFTTFPTKLSNQTASSKLAEIAIMKLELFKNLSTTLTSQPYSITSSHCSHLELVVHRTLFDLICFMCHQVHMSSLHQSVRKDLVIVMCQLVRPISLYSDVKLLKTGFSKMLEDLSLSFPMNLDMLKVVSSLMDSSSITREGQSEVARILSDFLDNLSWFCDGRSVEGNYVAMVNQYDDDEKCAKSCKLTTRYQPYDTRKSILTLEKDQDGFLLDNNAVFCVHYSAWDVVSAEIEMTHLLLSSNTIDGGWSIGPSMVTTVRAQFERLETILDFLSVCVKSDVRRDFAAALFFELWDLLDSEQFLVDGCEGSLIRMIDLAGLVLSMSSDRRDIARIICSKSVFPSAHTLSHDASPDNSLITRVWQSLASPTSTNIVLAYLRFSRELISVERFLDGDEGIIPPSVIFGSVSFVAKTLLGDVSQPLSPKSVSAVASGLNFLGEILAMEPSLYSSLSPVRRSRLELIRHGTLEVVAQNANTLRTLLSLSSIEVESLIAQTDVSRQMLAIDGTDQETSQIVLMSLTLVRHVLYAPFPGEANIIIEILNSAAGARKGSTMTFAHRYVLRLLELLGFSFGSKICRMALIVLKLLVVNTGVSVVACLGEKSGVVKDTLLRFLGSGDLDQATRALVFDFVADCVMCGRHGVLQLLFGNNVGEQNVIYQSCLDVLKGYKPNDNVSMSLLVSVSKFLSTLWIKDCQSHLDVQKNTRLWSSLLEPLRICVTRMSNNEILELPLYDYIGNVCGLFAMELFSSSCLDSTYDIVTALNDVIGQAFMHDFLLSFDVAVLDNKNLNRQTYLEKLVTTTTWWKALLYTLLSMDKKHGVGWISVSEECRLLHKILDSVSNLSQITMSTDVAWIQVAELIDTLMSCVVNIVQKRVKSISCEQADALLDHIISSLTSMLSVSSFQAHRCHVDILASCSHIVLEHSVTPPTLQKTAHLTEQFLLMLTSRPSSSTIDNKTLAHCITVCMALNKDPQGSHQWAASLAYNGTLVNCISLLHDKVKCADFSLLTQTILTLLVQMSGTRLGATRLLQSFLVHVLEIDLRSPDDDPSVVPYLGLVTRLVLALLHQTGSGAHALAFRFVSAHWERLECLIKGASQRLMTPIESTEGYDSISDTLALAGALFDLLWCLVEIKGVWALHWSRSTVAGLMGLMLLCANVTIAVLNEPHTVFVPDSAHICRGASRSMRNVSLALTSPKNKYSAPVFENSMSDVPSLQMRMASSRLEAVLYGLINSCLMLFSRSTYLASEDDIFSGYEYSGTLLFCDFGDRMTEDRSSSLSFGCLFSLLGATQSHLRENIVPIVIGLEKVALDGALIRQTHEIALGLIVSHSIIHLSKFNHSEKIQRSNFILNVKSELNCYIDGLSKSRRRSTLSSNSPISHGPKVTSTPYVVRQSSVGECLDGFCVAVDSFKKSLDYF